METSTFDARPAGGAIDAGASAGAARPDAPQLRTLLLTDLCDSTSLVERLGDGPAADLFREHDALVLRLQQQWRARLIDRSDGLLLLFERPIDGLGFALDYARGLRDIGTSRGHVLQARAGLHVGEVLTWRNSDEAVRVGAKPLEVEGLAKPMAGRLMAMARPGQILLSAVAEPLTHRAARELGTRGEQLVWKSHGRWRFKGVPQAQEIFEVGEPALAPLRAPASTPKAWRDIPLWRRPAALAAQAAVLGAIAVGTWFALRPQPAIAFGERDWVVVGDLRNLTGQPVLDESLEQAFRISLEQSRYVNVLSDLKARDTLARMRRPADTKLDRAIASEIALRDGARAVILPTVAEVGGRVRVSAEVVDPSTHATVRVIQAEGRGIGSVLASVDEVAQGLRDTLGEQETDLERDGRPLPDVTTSNLDALRTYALAQRAYGSSRFNDAAQLYQQATQMDPGFALAYIGGVRARLASGATSDVGELLARAQSQRDNLPTREQLYLDAWMAEARTPNEAEQKWTLLGTLYPDYFAASANLAALQLENSDYAEARVTAIRASDGHNPLRAFALDLQGRANMGLERLLDAEQNLTDAHKAGARDSARRLASVYAAKRQFNLAWRWLDNPESQGVGGQLGLVSMERIAFLLDQGQVASANDAAEKWAKELDSNSGHLRPLAFIHAAVAAAADGKTDKASRLLSDVFRVASAIRTGDEALEASEYAYMALSAAYIASRIGDDELADRALKDPDLASRVALDPAARSMLRVLKAQVAVRAGRPQEAIGILQEDGGDGLPYQAMVVRSKAYDALGDSQSAKRERERAASSRGRAYVELAGFQSLKALNVWDSNLRPLPSEHGRGADRSDPLRAS